MYASIKRIIIKGVFFYRQNILLYIINTRLKISRDQEFSVSPTDGTVSYLIISSKAYAS